MPSPIADRSPLITAAQSAFIIYKPGSPDAEASVFYNSEAWQILSYPTGKPKKDPPKPPDVAALCVKWARVFEKQAKEGTGADKAGLSDYIDIIPSGRRRYMVRGLLLAGQSASPQPGDHYYMFMLERVSADSVNLPMIFRQWNLSPREQDLVKMLIADKSNKEIAYLLDLSLNTVKGYMKLLMRKLGVASRAGIVACLLTKKVERPEEKSRSSPP